MVKSGKQAWSMDTAGSNMHRAATALAPKPFENPPDTHRYLKRTCRALVISAINQLPAPRTARAGPLVQHAARGPAHTISGRSAAKAAKAQVCYTARTALYRTSECFSCYHLMNPGRKIRGTGMLYRTLAATGVRMRRTYLHCDLARTAFLSNKS